MIHLVSSLLSLSDNIVELKNVRLDVKIYKSMVQHFPLVNGE